MGSFFGGIRFQIAGSIIAVSIVIITLLNIFPVLITEQLISDSNNDKLSARVETIASTVSQIETLTSSRVSLALEYFSIYNDERLIITDNVGKCLFDSSRVDSQVKKYMLQPEISAAMRGQDVFSCQFTDEFVYSTAACPIFLRGNLIGVAYLHESDAEQATFLSGIRSTIARFSVIIGVIIGGVTVAMMVILTKRFLRLYSAIDDMRSGEYSSTGARGKDELSTLAARMDELATEIQQNEDRRKQFVSDASHELRTPLSSMRLLADAILQSQDMPADMVREFVGDIGTEIDRLTRITGKMLTLTKLSSRTPNLTAVNMADTVNVSAHMLGPVSERADVKLTCSVGDDCIVYADGDSIYQIVYNLMENAIKYNRRGGEENVFLYKKEGSVFFIVDDTGPGIPESEREHIFERFYRIDKARSRSAGGTGLGLAIVSENTTKFGGKIHVEPSVSGGSRFIVQLPEYLPEAASDEECSADGGDENEA